MNKHVEAAFRRAGEHETRIGRHNEMRGAISAQDWPLLARLVAEEQEHVAAKAIADGGT